MSDHPPTQPPDRGPSDETTDLSDATRSVPVTSLGPIPGAAPPLASAPPSRIGPYRVFHELGRGGMGRVYRGVRVDDPLGRHVAIKVLRRGTDTDEVLARFERERTLLQMLDHPGIVRYRDAGATEDGRPYFVMEHVEGIRLDEYCARRRLSIVDRLELFRRICVAVHHAHSRLIVHRDLKPANVLVTANGDPKLLDFGIAKLLDPTAGPAGHDPTVPGLQLLTPRYASPEQVRGEPIGASSDVYALGVMLYELLTGHRPYRFEDRTKAAVRHGVCEVEPKRPSLVVTLPLEEVDEVTGETQTTAPEDVSRAFGESASRLRRRLAGDLDNIVMTALRKEPQRRYASAEKLSDEIRRYLRGDPVEATPDTLGYRVSRFARRNRPLVGAVAGVALVLAASATVATFGYREAEQEASAARRALAVAMSVTDELLEELRRLSNEPSARARRADILTRLSGLEEEIGRIDPSTLDWLRYRMQVRLHRSRLAYDSRQQSEGSLEDAIRLADEALGLAAAADPEDAAALDALVADVEAQRAELEAARDVGVQDFARRLALTGGLLARWPDGPDAEAPADRFAWATAATTHARALKESGAAIAGPDGWLTLVTRAHDAKLELQGRGHDLPGLERSISASAILLGYGRTAQRDGLTTLEIVQHLREARDLYGEAYDVRRGLLEAAIDRRLVDDHQAARDVVVAGMYAGELELVLVPYGTGSIETGLERFERSLELGARICLEQASDEKRILGNLGTAVRMLGERTRGTEAARPASLLLVELADALAPLVDEPDRRATAALVGHAIETARSLLDGVPFGAEQRRLQTASERVARHLTFERPGTEVEWTLLVLAELVRVDALLADPSRDEAAERRAIERLESLARRSLAQRSEDPRILRLRAELLTHEADLHGRLGNPARARVARSEASSLRSTAARDR